VGPSSYGPLPENLRILNATSDPSPLASMKATLAAAIFIALVRAASAQPSPEEEDPVKKAVLANDRAYEAAFAKGDVKALTAFFAEDADFTTEDGRTFSGIAEIEASIREGATANKGAKLVISADTVKVLAPDVVLEKGATSVTSQSGEISGALYTAIHVKKNDKWKISQLVETPLPELTPHERLSELAWLIGEWQEQDKAAGITVQTTATWAKGGNFITRNINVKLGGETTLEGWQIIGWDPVDQCIRSWTFDGEGGFGEAAWSRQGDRWLVRESGVNPAGGRITAENTITKLGADRFTWESNNRTLDGEPQPSAPRIEISRVKGN
jgi:uncharacterized protein (TIGR02246 family)